MDFLPNCIQLLKWGAKFNDRRVRLTSKTWPNENLSYLKKALKWWWYGPLSGKGNHSECLEKQEGEESLFLKSCVDDQCLLWLADPQNVQHASEELICSQRADLWRITLRSLTRPARGCFSMYFPAKPTMYSNSLQPRSAGMSSDSLTPIKEHKCRISLSSRFLFSLFSHHSHAHKQTHAPNRTFKPYTLAWGSGWVYFGRERA